MKRIALLLFCAVALAATTKERIITIESPDASAKRSGDLRDGPWVYEATKPGSLIGKVKDLQITALKVTLAAPKGKTMQAAEGERVATFENSVVVKRERMTAQGPKLVYSESTGKGVLDGGAKMHQEPKDPKSDAVDVVAPRMTFEVDTNISTSEGGVTLKNGRQEGKSEAVYYEEDRGLAVFTDPKEVVLTRKREGGDLIIQGKEIRSLTDAKRLIATGGVTLIDGDITTTGASLYYDDNTGEAIILGDRAKGIPAKSVNKKDNATLSSGTLKQNVNTKRVQLYSQPFKLPEADFKKAGS